MLGFGRAIVCSRAFALHEKERRLCPVVDDDDVRCDSEVDRRELDTFGPYYGLCLHQILRTCCLDTED